jgi:PAS domain-containing protein
MVLVTLCGPLPVKGHLRSSFHGYSKQKQPLRECLKRQTVCDSMMASTRFCEPLTAVASASGLTLQEAFGKMSRKCMRADLRDEEALFCDLFSSIGLAVIDKQGRYRALNNTLARMNGVPIDAHLGRTLRQTLGNLARKIEPLLADVFSSGEPILSIEIVGRPAAKRDQGRVVLNLFPMKSRKGKVQRVGVIVVELPQEASLVAMPEKSPVLRSWKDIARYIGTSVRTIQRWEQEYEFPVRRVNPGKGSAVFALRDEIEEWLRKQS